MFITIGVANNNTYVDASNDETFETNVSFAKSSEAMCSEDGNT